MKIILLAIVICFTHVCSAQLNLLKVASTKANSLLISSSLNKEEVAKGLREALVVGAENATKSASSKGGFLNNKAIRIPFPSEAQKMKNTLQKDHSHVLGGAFVKHSVSANAFFFFTACG